MLCCCFNSSKPSLLDRVILLLNHLYVTKGTSSDANIFDTEPFVSELITKDKNKSVLPSFLPIVCRIRLVISLQRHITNCWRSSFGSLDNLQLPSQGVALLGLKNKKTLHEILLALRSEAAQASFS